MNNDLTTLKDQLSKLPTIEELNQLSVELAQLPSKILLKQATDGDYLVAHTTLEQLKVKFHERAPLEARIRNLQAEQTEAALQNKIAASKALKGLHAQQYAMYKQSCARLLGDLKELLVLEQQCGTVATPGWNGQNERLLNLPAINPPGTVGETAKWL